MTQHDVRGVGIEVESYGSEAAPAFLLIRGLSTQLMFTSQFTLHQLVLKVIFFISTLSPMIQQDKPPVRRSW